MKPGTKYCAIGFCSILAIVAVVSFSIAVWVGCSAVKPEPKIQVYINGNDSIIQGLQTDVKHLSDILNKMQNDSIVVTVSRIQTGIPSRDVGEE